MTSHHNRFPGRLTARFSALCAAAMLSVLGAASAADAYESFRPARERIESLCRPWTVSPCIAKVGGSLRSARSGNPLPGKKLRFVAGGTVICASVTDVAGHASCVGVVPSGRGLAQSGYRILFDGDDRFIAGSAQGRASARSARLAQTEPTRSAR